MGKVIIAGAGPGDPGLVTLKTYKAITEADLIIYDSLINPSILEWAKPNAVLRNMGKRCGNTPFSQEDINKALVEAGHQFSLVLRLKGGDPFIFGRGGEEALALIEAGISFEIIPGISSSVAGPAYAGIPVTHRGMAVSYSVITGHEAPGKQSSDIHWDSLKGIHTLVFLMGVGNRQEIAKKLIEVGRNSEEPCVFIENATTSNQRVVRSCLTEVAENPPFVEAPAIMVIGSTAGLNLEWFEPSTISQAQHRREQPSLHM